MPSIRFKDKNGSCFILYGNNASWGTGDFNNPVTAEVVSDTITMCNRCSNSISINTSSGLVTLYLNLNGRTGSCNQCGQCCSHLASTCTYGASCGYSKIIGLFHCCPNLVASGSGVGKKNGTSCSIYNRLLYEGYKSCVTFPSEVYEIANRPMCGFKF